MNLELTGTLELNGRKTPVTLFLEVKTKPANERSKK